MRERAGATAGMEAERAEAGPDLISGGSARDAAGDGVALEAGEVGSQIGGALIAQGAIFLQGFVDDALQIGGHVGIEAHRRDGGCVENGFEDLGGTAAVKGERAGRHLVENDAEGEEIGAGVEIFGARLLG